MSNNTEIKLFKILCLHGYRQNGEIFRQKLGGLRKALKKHAEFVFITAPNELPPPKSTTESSEETDGTGQYGWWFSTENRTFDSKKASDLSLGFGDSLKLIEKTFEEQGPFDGLLGFSQGAAFVGILCGMQETNMLKYEFGFAIIIAGFKSQCLPHLNYYFKDSSIPSLHVYGENDSCISKEMSEELLQHFEDTEIILHPGGHYVPASATERKIYIAFLEERRKELMILEERKKKQIQVGSYILERIDSGSEEVSEGEDKIIYMSDSNSDSSEESKMKTKANKGGITKQTRRKILAESMAKKAENDSESHIEEK